MMAGPQGQPAYHESQSPNPTPAAFSTAHHSPTAVPLPHHQHNHHPAPHPAAHPPPHPAPHPAAPHPHARPLHRSPTSPGAPELPPISTAIYARDRNAYYDPTQDNGVGRDAAPHSSHLPAPVRSCCHAPCTHSDVYTHTHSDVYTHKHTHTRIRHPLVHPLMDAITPTRCNAMQRNVCGHRAT